MLQSSSFEKKLIKSLKKNAFLGPVYTKRGHYGPRPSRKTIVLAEITKADHQLLETFYFIKISYVFVKKVPFPAKKVVGMFMTMRKLPRNRHFWKNWYHT